MAARKRIEDDVEAVEALQLLHNKGWSASQVAKAVKLLDDGYEFIEDQCANCGDITWNLSLRGKRCRVCGSQKWCKPGLFKKEEVPCPGSTASS